MCIICNNKLVTIHGNCSSYSRDNIVEYITSLCSVIANGMQDNTVYENRPIIQLRCFIQYFYPLHISWIIVLRLYSSYYYHMIPTYIINIIYIYIYG